MSHESCVLRTAAGDAVPLRSVHIDTAIDGLIARTVVRQTYRNTDDQPIEAVYTFPLPWDATLLGLQVEWGGKRMAGEVIEKREAQERYEAAIDAGDSPVMVARSGSGLFTANLGNLLPQETAVIELEYAQLLRFEQGRVRVAIPATVAPRYGDEHADGGLAAHETAQAGSLAEYPLQFTARVRGAMARARIGCPSHPASVQRTDDGVEIRLNQGAMLDRDVILLLDDLQDRSLAVRAADGGTHAVVASFCPRLPPQPPEALQMKLLVDCSGSMQGDSIVQAREALHQVLAQLVPQDRVSFTRFGNVPMHVVPRLARCTPAHVAAALAPAVQGTQADMGGTELGAALAQTIALRLPLTERPADILLITDGEVWDVDAIVADAAGSGHRIFAIGVGAAPAESLLRDLAERTGGACEFVSPNEDMRGAALRMVARMRAPHLGQVVMDWGVAPVWQGTLPRQIFDGDTVHVFALLPAAPAERPSLSWAVGDTSQRAVCEPLAEGPDAPAVARLLGARRLQEASSREERLALALQYQLVSQETHLFLVHVRADDEKAQGLPVLQQVPQMTAAGWGGMGTVNAAAQVSHFAAPGPALFRTVRDNAPSGSSVVHIPSVWRTNRTQTSARVNALSSGGMDDFEIPMFLRKQDADFAPRAASLSPQALLERFNTLARQHASLHDALTELLGDQIPVSIKRLMQSMARDCGSAEAAWALLLEWLSDALVPEVPPDRHGARLIRASLAHVPSQALDAARQRLAAAYPRLCAGHWGPARRSLLRALIEKVS